MWRHAHPRSGIAWFTYICVAYLRRLSSQPRLAINDDGDGDEVLTRRVDNAAKWHPARTRLVARITRRPRRRWHHEAAASYL